MIPARNLRTNAKDRARVAPLRQLSQALLAGQCVPSDLTIAQIDAVQELWLKQWLARKGIRWTPRRW